MWLCYHNACLQTCHFWRKQIGCLTVLETRSLKSPSLPKTSEGNTLLPVLLPIVTSRNLRFSSSGAAWFYSLCLHLATCLVPCFQDELSCMKFRYSYLQIFNISISAKSTPVSLSPFLFMLGVEPAHICLAITWTTGLILVYRVRF